MSTYNPDLWVVVKITGNKGIPPCHKVFATWNGGYAGADTWKLNSGIIKASLVENVYSFEGSSGSVYHCHKDSYRTNLYGTGILHNLIGPAEAQGVTIEILPEQTNWLGINYE
jgi:hypothetical protein